MKFKLIRENFTEFYTEGKLYIDDIFFAYTLEDRVRDLNMDGDLDDPGEGKIYGETAIPYGKYKMLLTKSPKFNADLPLILSVKHFIGIRIHWGTDRIDTAGCILIGNSRAEGRVYYSRDAVRKLVQKLKSSNEEEWEIEVV